MKKKDLKVGFFYWIEIYEYGDSLTTVLAKIISIIKCGSGLVVYNIQVLNPLTGAISERALGPSFFIKKASFNEVRIAVDKFRKRLADFIKQ